MNNPCIRSGMFMHIISVKLILMLQYTRNHLFLFPDHTIENITKSRNWKSL